jgi:hypothetical protein
MDEAGEQAADQSEVTAHARGGRAARVVRAIAAVVVMSAGCIAAVMAADFGGSWSGFAMTLGDLFGIGEYIGMGLLVCFLIAPVALLAGTIARPHWWAPAIAPFALGWLVWVILIVDGLAQPMSEDFWLALVLHVGCTGVALVFGLLGARVSAGRVGAYFAATFGTLWLALLVAGAAAAEGVVWETGSGVWVLTMSVEVAAFAMLLAAYWARDPGRWWLLGIGGTLWLIGLAAIAGAALWLGWMGELERHVPWLLTTLNAAWLGLLAFIAAAGRRWRIGGRVPFGRAVLLVGIVATLGLGALVKGYAPGPVLSGEVVYARLGVSPGVEIYFQFDERGMRVARSAHELATAEPVAAAERDGMRAVFPEVDLPVEADELPARCNQLKAKCMVYDFGANAWGRRSLAMDMICVISPGFVYEDEAGAEWTYWIGGIGMDAATSAQQADVLSVPLSVLAQPTVEVTAQVDQEGEDQVGLAITVTSGEMSFDGIEKDGEAVEATLVVRDSNGDTVVTKRGTLEDLGFT